MSEYPFRKLQKVLQRGEPWIEGENGDRKRYTESPEYGRVVEEEYYNGDGKLTYYSRTTRTTYIGIRYENGKAVEETVSYIVNPVSGEVHTGITDLRRGTHRCETVSAEKRRTFRLTKS